MKRMWKCILAFVLSILALTSLCLIEPKETYASSDYHTVTFNFNRDRVLTYLTDTDGTISTSLKTYSITVADGEYASETKSLISQVSQYYRYTWTVNGVEVDLNTYPITEDTAFFASWTPKSYKVYFHSDGAESEVTNYVSSLEFNIESQRIVLFKPNRPHYAFNGWYENSNDAGEIECLYIRPTDVGDKNLYARFTPIEYYINYNTDATHNNPRGYNVEDDDFTLLNPTKEGHIFQGWYLDSNYTTAVTSIDCSDGGNLELYAKWELEKYKVTYILPSGLTKEVITEYGKTAELPQINKSIFEIVKISISRKNITSDTTIEIELVNIWYVYVLILLAVAGTITLIIVIKKKRERAHSNLRNMYYSNVNKNKRKY